MKKRSINSTFDLMKKIVEAYNELENDAEWLDEDETFSTNDHHDHVLNEMARVGWMGIGNNINEFEIYVWTDDPGNIPHVHIRDAATRGMEFETCVELGENKYFLHGKYQDIFNSKQRKAFHKFMKLKPGDDEPFNTNYEAAIYLWNKNNSSMKIMAQRDKDGNVIVPDYSKLSR